MRSFKARQEARRRAYGAAFVLVTLAGGIAFVSGFFARASKEVHDKFYRDPKRVLIRLAELQTVFFYREKRYAVSLKDLEEKKLITAELGSGELEGYRYKLHSPDPTSFTITADPARIGSTTHFYVDQSHVVRAEENAAAGPTSQIVWSPRDGQAR